MRLYDPGLQPVHMQMILALYFRDFLGSRKGGSLYAIFYAKLFKCIKLNRL